MDRKDIARRINHLDRIAADLEDAILAGRGDTEDQRREWRACQDEIRELEALIPAPAKEE